MCQAHGEKMSQLITLKNGSRCRLLKAKFSNAAHDDVAAIRDLFSLINRDERRRTGNANLGTPWHQRTVSYIEKENNGSSRHLVMLAKQLNGNPIGFMRMLSYLKEDGAHLELLGIHPEHQGNGLGSALLKAAEDFSSVNEKTFIKLRVSQSGAVEFYNRHGYINYDTSSTQSGPDIAHMYKPLSPGTNPSNMS